MSPTTHKSPTIHKEGSIVIDSGIYDVVDCHGTYLNHQEACIENQTFPKLTDPRAQGGGYVLHSKTRHVHPPKVVWRPRQRVRYSGIYDVVDSDGRYLDHQITCVAGRIFPPIHDIPHGDGYVLHERASHMKKIYLPQETVPSTGTYDSVDLEGLTVGSPVHCEVGTPFPNPTHEDGIGFMLREAHLTKRAARQKSQEEPILQMR